MRDARCLTRKVFPITQTHLVSSTKGNARPHQHVPVIYMITSSASSSVHSLCRMAQPCRGVFSFGTLTKALHDLQFHHGRRGISSDWSLSHQKRGNLHGFWEDLLGSVHDLRLYKLSDRYHTVPLAMPARNSYIYQAKQGGMSVPQPFSRRAPLAALRTWTTCPSYQF